MGFNCLKATKPLRGDSFLFSTQALGVPGTHLMDLGRMKGCSLPCSHPAVLNLGLLDWESSTLTTQVIGKRYVRCKDPVFRINRINIIGGTFVFYALLAISPLDKILQWLF